MTERHVRATPHDDAEWLTCRDLVELVTDYFDGALSHADRLRFEEHVSVCPPCRVHLRQMRETVRLLGTLDEEDVPPAARDALLSAFRDWKRERGEPEERPPA
jgi:anti-sigma factor RsiW